MCSYCGCEAESIISDLMEDHAVIADLGYRVNRALDADRLEEARRLASQVDQLFARHSSKEESGLFAQLRAAGDALDEVDRLEAEHRYLRSGLSDPGVVDAPDRLRQLLGDLARHAEIEETDLFPFAIQQLPDAAWEELTAGTNA